LGWWSSSKFWSFPIIYLQWLGLATSNLACSWGLSRPMIKSHAEERVGMALGKELSKIWGFLSIFTEWLKLATSNLVHNLGSPRPMIKPHPQEKWAWLWAREATRYLGFPIIFLQRLHCPLSVSGASCYAKLQNVSICNTIIINNNSHINAVKNLCYYSCSNSKLVNIICKRAQWSAKAESEAQEKRH